MADKLKQMLDELLGARCDFDKTADYSHKSFLLNRLYAESVKKIQKISSY